MKIITIKENKKSRNYEKNLTVKLKKCDFALDEKSI